MTAPIAPCAQNIGTETLSAWRDDGLPADQAQALAGHTPTCAACQAHLADYDAVARALLRQRELDPADRVVAGVRARADRHQRRRARAHIWGGLGALTSAAALVLLFVYVFSPALGNHPQRFGYTTYHLPDPSYTVADLVTTPGGDAWFSEIQIVPGTGQNSGYTQGHAKIGRISPAGQLTEYPLPATDNLDTAVTGGPVVSGGLTVGSNGAIWFVKLAGGLVHTALPQQRIVKLTADGTMTSYGLPGPSSIFIQPSVSTPLVAGPDGNLWFGLGIVTQPGQSPATTATAMTLARITTAGAIKTFTLPSPYDQHSMFGDLVAGPDGNLWFTVQSFNADGSGGSEVIARATPSGAITIYSLPNAKLAATSLVSGPDGNLWFAESPAGTVTGPSMIARITPSGQIEQYPITFPGTAAFISLTPGRDGTLYFNAVGGCSGQCVQLQSVIGRITAAGQVTEFALPNQGHDLIADGLVATADGSLYFAELGINSSHTTFTGTNRLARITPDGHLSEYTVPSSIGNAFGLTAGTDNTLWLTVAPEAGKPGTTTILHITLPAS